MLTKELLSRHSNIEQASIDYICGNELIKNRTALMTFGGSYAYGTNKIGSDVDIRGFAMNTPEEILLGRDFEQIVDSETDTTIYSINKAFELLTVCNPNTIEILGCRPDQYIYLNEIGQMLLDNKQVFLSQRACKTFAGYANQQLRRLENHSARFSDQKRNEEHILATIQHQQAEFIRKYPQYDKKKFRIYMDKSDREDLEYEIFLDADIDKYPIRDFKDMWRDMYNIINSYNTIGSRNSKAFEHKKIGKHMMHLVRLYYMAFDILESLEIVTYREKEHDLLMKIRNGEFLNENNQPTSEFYEMVDELEKRFDYARQNTVLPVEPDMKRIDELHIDVNKKILKDDIEAYNKLL